MGLAQPNHRATLPPASFDEFVAQRPDHEIWELIDGHFVMQALPTFTHQVIAGNVERLLNDALENARPELLAMQAPAIDLGETSEVGGTTYVPDVGVLDRSDVDAGLAKSAVCHLDVEVVSPSDRRPVSDASRRRKIDVKVEGYRHLASCEAIMVIEQDEPMVTVSVREGTIWSEAIHRLPDDVVELPRFGFRHTLADIYARTVVLQAVPPSGLAR